MAAIALMVSLTAVSCKKKETDADLQARATATVAANPKASVEVKDGTAHLSGTFADQTSRDNMIASLKAIPGIKDVMDMSTIEAPVAPVQTTTAVDPAVTQKVKDALKDFPTVKAEVVNGTLTLTGTATKEQAVKVKQSVDALKIGKYDNKITVK